MGIKPLKHNVAISFVTKITIISFDSATPSSEDLSGYFHIELTADAPWDPINVKLVALSHECVSNTSSYSVTSKVGIDAVPEDPQVHYNESEWMEFYQVFLLHTPK